MSNTIDFESYDVILWDFDGVILDSMAVRDLGFEKVLSEFPTNDVQALLKYHRINGGLSRYVKFRYFYEEILMKPISDEGVQNLAAKFSDIMRELLVDPKNLIQDSVGFIDKVHDKIPMHIVSGSDQEELRFLCRQLGVADYFVSIHGSPTPKKVLVARLLEQYKKYLLIGDSINDFEAADENNIDFAGYNNTELKGLGIGYIYEFGAK